MTPSSPTTISTLLQPLSAPPVRNEVREVVRTDRASSATDAPEVPFVERLRAQTEPAVPSSTESTDDQAPDVPADQPAEPVGEVTETDGDVKQETAERPADGTPEAPFPVAIDVEIPRPVGQPVIAHDSGQEQQRQPVGSTTTVPIDSEILANESRPTVATIGRSDSRHLTGQTKQEIAQLQPLPTAQPVQRPGPEDVPQPIDRDTPKQSDVDERAEQRQIRTHTASTPIASDAPTTREIVNPAVTGSERVRTEAVRSDVPQEVRTAVEAPPVADRAETQTDSGAADQRSAHRDQTPDQKRPVDVKTVAIEERPAQTSAPISGRAEQQGETLVKPAEAQPSTTPTATETQAAPKIAESPVSQRVAGPTLQRAEGAPLSVEAQITRGVGAVLTQRGGSVTLKLAPSSLGTVKVSMRVDAGMVSIDLEATTERAHRALTKDLGALKASFEQRGVQVDRAQVHLAPAPTPGLAQADQSQQRGTDQHDQREEPARDDSRGEHRRSGDGRRNDDDRNFARYAQDASLWGEEGTPIGLSAEA